jgi:hypothetical protein
MLTKEASNAILKHKKALHHYDAGLSFLFCDQRW